MPFRLEFRAFGGGDAEDVRRNIEFSKGFPRAEKKERDYPVAVVGGGPLLDLEAVRKWPGDIWAINRTADFLLSHGIDCTFFTVDSFPFETTAAKRLVSSNADVSLFAGDVQVFDSSDHVPGGIHGGTTSASRAPMLALSMGYPGVVFFGCESSFGESTHIDRDCVETKRNLVIVHADDQDWITSPQMLLQAQELSWFIKNTDVFKEESGGMLRAILKDDDWSVVAVNDSMKAHLIEVNGDSGLFDAPYVCPECGRRGSHYDDCPIGLGVFA
jgi:hypothetical protein